MACKHTMVRFASIGPTGPSGRSRKLQGKLQGTEINLCMRLVHYVVMQGLGVTRDWNASAHENASFVSSVHLRNMSHVSLGCLSLLLHTCIDKALVPVNRSADAPAFLQSN